MMGVWSVSDDQNRKHDTTAEDWRNEDETHVLGVMADAMLEPALRERGITTQPSGNKVRKQVLRRALQAAEAYGWRLIRV
jgi:hypothetical protein